MVEWFATGHRQMKADLYILPLKCILFTFLGNIILITAIETGQLEILLLSKLETIDSLHLEFCEFIHA